MNKKFLCLVFASVLSLTSCNYFVVDDNDNVAKEIDVKKDVALEESKGSNRKYEKKEIYQNGKKVEVEVFGHGDHYHILYNGVEYVVSEKRYKELLEKDNTYILKKRKSKKNVALENEVGRNDNAKIISSVKHGDHWHIKLSDGSEYVSYEDPSKSESVKNSINKNISDNKRRKEVSRYKHGDHYHIKFDDGTEKVVYISASNENQKVDKKLENNNVKIVSSYKHGDHWHIKLSDGSEYVSYEDPSKSEIVKSSTSNNVSDKKERREVSRYRHGDHYHIVYDDGTEEVVYDNNMSAENTDNDNHKAGEITKTQIFSKVIIQDDLYYVMYNNSAYVLSKTEYDDANKNSKLSYEDIVKNEDFEKKLDKVAEVSKVSKEEIAFRNNTFYVPHIDHLHLFLYESVDVGNKESSLIDSLSDEQLLEIQNKKEYLVYVFGKTPGGKDAVPLEAIRLYEYKGELYFSYNEPSEEYDPTHVHPVSVRVDRVIIPEKSDVAEIDFINEIEATGFRVGIIPEEIRIENKRFLIPHKNHNHSILIRSQGYEEYLKNKLEVEKSSKIEGDFNADEVVYEADRLIEEAKKLSDVEYRRINRALDYFKYEIKKNEKIGFVANSTQGYKNDLKKFADRYIYKTVDVEMEMSQEDKEVKKEVDIINDILRDSAFLNATDLGGIAKATVLDSIKNAQDKKDIDRLKEIQHFMFELKSLHDKTNIRGASYIVYFLDNVENYGIDESVRNEMAYLIVQFVDKNYVPSENDFARMVNAYRLSKGREEIFNIEKNYDSMYGISPIEKLDSPPTFSMHFNYKSAIESDIKGQPYLEQLP